MEFTKNSRTALARARFFLEQAKASSNAEGFEAFVEACIVFARSSLHRLDTRFKKEKGWSEWWRPLRDDPAVVFMKKERDHVLKEGPAKIGQVVHVQSIPSTSVVGGDLSAPAAVSCEARKEIGDCYWYEKDVPATETLERHLRRLEDLSRDAHAKFSAGFPASGA